MKALTGILLFSEVLLLSQITECAVRFMVKEHCNADDNEPWSYHGRDNNPNFWGEKFQKCYGENQSPIEINTDKVKLNTNLQKLVMTNYDKPITKATIVNNGHTVQITPKDGISRTIVAEGKTFTLQQIHFHWGSTYYEGSEHILDEQQYAMEGHLVHTSEKNKIAVVAVIFQERDLVNAALQPIIDELSKIPYKNNEVQIKGELDLNNFVPSNPGSFYRYSGSLTTPGCTEGVIWSILHGIMPVGYEQMEQFRNLYSTVKEEASSGCKLVNNYRPVQPLVFRPIYSSL